MTLKGGTYIVTGATGGIGSAIVRGLVERQAARVILACRNLDKARSLIAATASGDTRLEAMELNLESLASVRAFADSVITAGIRVDGLFNNAGTMPGEMRLTRDGYESATQVNFLATGLLTRLLLPALNNGSGIVFTTSMTRRIAKLRDDWRDRSVTHHHRFTTYGRSKLMITHYVIELARGLECRAIRVNCSDPGIVDSAIITMGNRVVDRLSDMLFRPLISTPEQGAAPALRAMESNLTSHIFTLKKERRIPRKYEEDPHHHIPTATISCLIEEV